MRSHDQLWRLTFARSPPHTQTSVRTYNTYSQHIQTLTFDLSPLTQINLDAGLGAHTRTDTHAHACFRRTVEPSTPCFLLSGKRRKNFFFNIKNYHLLLCWNFSSLSGAFPLVCLCRTRRMLLFLCINERVNGAPWEKKPLFF